MLASSLSSVVAQRETTQNPPISSEFLHPPFPFPLRRSREAREVSVLAILTDDAIFTIPSPPTRCCDPAPTSLSSCYIHASPALDTPLFSSLCVINHPATWLYDPSLALSTRRAPPPRPHTTIQGPSIPERSRTNCGTCLIGAGSLATTRGARGCSRLLV